MTSNSFTMKQMTEFITVVPMTLAEAQEKSNEALANAKTEYKKFLNKLVTKINEHITKNLIYKKFEFNVDPTGNFIFDYQITKPYTTSDVFTDMERLYPNYKIFLVESRDQNNLKYGMSWE